MNKRDPSGTVRLSYPGRVLESSTGQVEILARWTETASYGHYSMQKDDPVRECFFAARWYNVITLLNARGDLRGWYCDICRPPVMKPNGNGSWLLDYVDMTMDIFIGRDHRPVLLDVKEFYRNRLPGLSRTEALHCFHAVHQVLAMARWGLGPFSAQGRPSCSMARR